MKTIILTMLMGLLAAATLTAEDLSQTDLKWKAAVEKKIAAGPTTISTPQETRAKLVQDLAKKAGRKSELVKTERGYQVKVL
jgi:hypothetical protein